MIAGVRIGHATDPVGLTGCTVILPEAPAVAGVEIRGWACGIHGLDVLDPRHLASHVHGLVLAGGSAYGLESVFGVMQYLEERGVGFPVARTVVPEIAGAILFDLGVGDHRVRPTRAMGYAACQAARTGPPAEGNVGAGTGATIGKLYGRERAMKGGLGAALGQQDGVSVGAVVAVNAVGDVRDPGSGRLLAGTRDAPDGRRLVDTARALAEGAPPPAFRPTGTTIGAIVTSAALTKPEARLLAALAMDGVARAVSPPHLRTDGDALFCLSVGDGVVSLDRLGLLAADTVAAAIVRAARAATALPGLPSARDLGADPLPAPTAER